MKRPKEKAFTLIEVLVVVSIVGVLSSMAIAHFTHYRTDTYNTAAKADLRTAGTAQEAYFVENNTYSSALGPLLATSYGLNVTDGVTLNITAADSVNYTMQAFHKGGDVIYTLSGPGGSITPL